MVQSSREIYWSAVIADFRRSGMTHVQFCQHRRISIHSFRKRLYRPHPTSLRSAPSKSPASQPSSQHPSALPDFLPVHIRSEHSRLTAPHQDAASPSVLELVLGRDRRLRIPVGFDPGTLRLILDVLEPQP